MAQLVGLNVDYDSDNNNAILSSFNSLEDYINAIKYTISEGLMNGVSDTEFSPRSSLTRAQAATLISRILDKINPVKQPNSTEDFESFDNSF